MRQPFRLMPALILVLAWPLAAAAITEPKTGTEYPDTTVVSCGDGGTELTATGVGLREKTFLKVDVYTIASYAPAGMDLGDDPGRTLLLDVDAPKRLRMDLRRSFSRDKLIGAFTEVIEKNYDDVSPFEADMALFTTYFDRDAEDGDVILFDWCPGTGLTTTLNGEAKGLIDNPAFAQALWTVWFGSKPADDGLKKDLLGLGD